VVKMSDVVVFDLFGLLQLVDKYPCDIPQQCSLFTESVFVLHPFLFWALMVFAVIGLIVVAWNIFKLYGVDVL
jgi:uncharacterized membrane protein